MYLSLPLPVQKNIKIEIVYVPYDPSQPPQRTIITIDKDASVKKLKNMVASQFNVEDSNNVRFNYFLNNNNNNNYIYIFNFIYLI